MASFPNCHSERSEESLFNWRKNNGQRSFPRFAREGKLGQKKVAQDDISCQFFILHFSEGSPSGLWRCPGKAVGRKASRVRIPLSPHGIKQL